MSSKAIEFMDLTGFQGLLKMTIDRLLEQYRNGLFSVIPEDKNEALDRAMSLVERAFRERSGELQLAVADVYSKRFSDEELTQLLDFYKSDVGKKLTESGFALQEDINRTSTEWTDKILREMDDQVGEILAVD